MQLFIEEPLSSTAWNSIGVTLNVKLRNIDYLNIIITKQQGKRKSQVQLRTIVALKFANQLEYWKLCTLSYYNGYHSLYVVYFCTL